ncbi:RNA polymerase sigma-I factor [Desertibacillus haloalkaliphilus]|uniref:RNA polymerase sigma-I factor n=1 Tax=Desertibacillus haloalkaliphilus TaxID=1328930 RepID=UPI001FE2E21C|nr:RNA polymerase sigma-I factor [Desertibacillus haloalkaliphilus]
MGDRSLHNEFIDQYKPFIAKHVSSVCKRYVDRTIDDEYSVGLIAFDEAIQQYAPDKGSSFLSFASLVIRRRVIDYIRQESKRQVATSLDHNEDLHENLENYAEVSASLDVFQEEIEISYRKEELLHFQERLKEFGITFSHLQKECPKHRDARENMAKVARVIIENEEVKAQLLEKKRLPIKPLLNDVDVSRKTLERNRKYLIALAIILLEDYVYIRDYVREWLK